MACGEKRTECQRAAHLATSWSSLSSGGMAHFTPLVHPPALRHTVICNAGKLLEQRGEGWLGDTASQLGIHLSGVGQRAGGHSQFLNSASFSEAPHLHRGQFRIVFKPKEGQWNKCVLKQMVRKTRHRGPPRTICSTRRGKHQRTA